MFTFPLHKTVFNLVSTCLLIKETYFSEAQEFSGQNLRFHFFVFFVLNHRIMKYLWFCILLHKLADITSGCSKGVWGKNDCFGCLSSLPPPLSSPPSPPASVFAFLVYCSLYKHKNLPMNSFAVHLEGYSHSFPEKAAGPSSLWIVLWHFSGVESQNVLRLEATATRWLLYVIDLCCRSKVTVKTGEEKDFSSEIKVSVLF